jgi:hypothetical protein
MAKLGVVVDWVFLDKTAPVRIGDLVSADAGGMPTYRVVGLEEDRAWLRDSDHDQVWEMPLAAFHWKAAI